MLHFCTDNDLGSSGILKSVPTLSQSPRWDTGGPLKRGWYSVPVTIYESSLDTMLKSLLSDERSSSNNNSSFSSSFSHTHLVRHQLSSTSLWTTKLRVWWDLTAEVVLSLSTDRVSNDSWHDSCPSPCIVREARINNLFLFSWVILFFILNNKDKILTPALRVSIICRLSSVLTRRIRVPVTIDKTEYFEDPVFEVLRFLRFPSSYTSSTCRVSFRPSQGPRRVLCLSKCFFRVLTLHLWLYRSSKWRRDAPVLCRGRSSLSNPYTHREIGGDVLSKSYVGEIPRLHEYPFGSRLPTRW